MTAAPSIPALEIAPKMASLFKPNRYKVRYGGRGKGSSWGFARTLIALMMDSTPLYADGHPLRVLCARETQKSIADSVHHLLETQIERMGLGWAFRVEKAKIYSHNGGEIIFAGLKHNVNNIKSLEDVDIVWVTEAQAVSKHTWETLIPTIRKDGSEIWIDYNPELDTDETHVRFALQPPPGADVVKMTFRDNPWFPKVLKLEMDHLRNTDPRAYDWVYEGNCKSAVEGAVFEKELQKVEQEGRIRQVPFTPGVPVHTYWDIGHADATAIWFVQSMPGEYRMLAYEEMIGGDVTSVMKMLQSKPYVYGAHHLPHDGKHQLFAAGGRSVQQQIQAYGHRCVVIPNHTIVNSLNATRTIFPQLWFDSEKCADGLQVLRHYRWPAATKSGVVPTEPLHDWASHGSSALQTMANHIREPIAKKETKAKRYYQAAGVWN